MAIEITCDCRKGYRVSVGKAGKRFKCRDCGALLQVPSVNDVTTNDADDDDALAVISSEKGFRSREVSDRNGGGTDLSF